MCMHLYGKQQTQQSALSPMNDPEHENKQTTKAASRSLSMAVDQTEFKCYWDTSQSSINRGGVSTGLKDPKDPVTPVMMSPGASKDVLQTK